MTRRDVRPFGPLAIVMVGLPARGKTHIARKLARYLNWVGRDTRLFNVGNYRRERLGGQQPAEFFDPGNRAGRVARLELAMEALDDLISWIADGGEVAIYDATNTTRARRKLIRERLTARGIGALFVESICDDGRIVESNIRETKVSSPDYVGVEATAAVVDFRARIAHYEHAYEPIDESELSYVKVIDVGRQLVVNRIHGFLPARLVFFLMNLHLVPRPIWFSRHGQSEFNRAGRIGGDSSLSPVGQQYPVKLGEWLDRYGRGDGDVVVWTSTLRRTIETAAKLSVPSQPWKALDEIDAGLCDGWTYPEIHERMPQDYAARDADKLRYRYPRGESYEDVIQRLEPVIIELEREQNPVLVIAHQAVIRALYAYFMDLPAEECPRLPVPLHGVIELTPRAYGCVERRFFLGPPVNEAHR